MKTRVLISAALVGFIQLATPTVAAAQQTTPELPGPRVEAVSVERFPDRERAAPALASSPTRALTDARLARSAPASHAISPDLDDPAVRWALAGAAVGAGAGLALVNSAAEGGGAVMAPAVLLAGGVIAAGAAIGAIIVGSIAYGVYH